MLGMTPGGNLRWQTRVRPTTCHRECTPNMATPLDSTSMMELVVVLADVNLFPGWLDAGPRVVVSVNRRGGCACTRQRRLRLPQRLTKNRWNSSCSAHQAAEDCYRDWSGWESLASTAWFRRAGYALRQSLVPAKMALESPRPL